jgi:hypothetical protein
MRRLQVSPARLASASLVAAAIALTACSAKDDGSVCVPFPQEAPTIVYPINGAKDVPVTVGELLYADSTLGTLYLTSAHGGPVAVIPQGIAPTPYPSPIATPTDYGGPIYRGTFGRLAPATTYAVRLSVPSIPGPCSGNPVFSSTTFTTK